MPINNTVDNDEKIIYSICTGTMEKKDFEDYIERIWSHNAHYGYNELFDTVEADWSQFDFGYLFEVASAAANLSSIAPDSKLAWVVLEGKQKELTEFYKTAKAMLPVKSRALESFYSKEEAMKWLKD